MKKIISMFLAAMMVLTLAACGDNGTPSTNQTVPTETQSAGIDAAAAEAEIRYALSLLVDRNYIAEEIAKGGQAPAASFVSMDVTDADGSYFAGNAGHSQDYAGYYDTSKEGYEDNYAKAYTILSRYYDVDENGMLTNFPTLTYLYGPGEGSRAVGEFLHTVFATVGIQLQLEELTGNTLQDSAGGGHYLVPHSGWLIDDDDPISFLEMWTTGSGGNAARLGEGDHASDAVYDLDLTGYGYDIQVEKGTWAQTYDVLISTIRTCTDRDTRYELMHLAEDLLMSTGAVMPLYFYSDLYLMSNSVEGCFSTPVGCKLFHRTTVNGSGESISVCLGPEPDSLDPALSETTDGAALISHLFAGLAKWDQDASGRTVLVPDCAEELVEGVANSDGTVTYTYTLKEGLKWSDGRKLTAHDFAFAWKRAASPELSARNGCLFDVIKGASDLGAGSEGGDLAVKALNDRTLEVTLTAPVPQWNALLACPAFFPVREDVVSNEAWASSSAALVSNGAYTITGWNHNALITMTKNENYHDAENVSMNHIRFFLSDDRDLMRTNFLAGTWQLIDDVSADELETLKTEFPGEFTAVGQSGTCYLTWDVNEPLLPEA